VSFAHNINVIVRCIIIIIIHLLF